jgi:hypothetical protein
VNLNLLTLRRIALHSQLAVGISLNKYRRLAGQGALERVYFCPILKDLAKTNFKIIATPEEGSNFSRKHIGFLTLSPKVDL